MLGRKISTWCAGTCYVGLLWVIVAGYVDFAIQCNKKKSLRPIPVYLRKQPLADSCFARSSSKSE